MSFLFINLSLINNQIWCKNKPVGIKKRTNQLSRPSPHKATFLLMNTYKNLSVNVTVPKQQNVITRKMGFLAIYLCLFLAAQQSFSRSSSLGLYLNIPPPPPQSEILVLFCKGFFLLEIVALHHYLLATYAAEARVHQELWVESVTGAALATVDLVRVLLEHFFGLFWNIIWYL